MRTKSTKIFTLILSVLFISIFAVALVSADDGYCLKKVYNGGTIPAYPGFTTKTEHLDCRNGLCTVYGYYNPTGHLVLCIDPDGYYYSNSLSRKCDEYCGGDGGPIDAGPLTLAVNFPFPDGGTFTKTNFFMDIYTNKIARIELLDNVAGTQKLLCPNCMVYKRSATFKQGFSNITIRAIVGSEIKESSITFFIDNKKPRIVKTLPMQNKFANGDFTVVYDEDNVKKIELSYGSDSSQPLTKELTGCPLGKRVNCTTTVDLSAFEGQQISYWFTITDRVDNIVTARPYKVKVDKTPPQVTFFNYTIEKSYVNFMFNITEQNIDKIYYTPNDEERQKILCSGFRKDKLNPYLLSCNRKMSFKPGHYVLSIEIKDKAGNISPKTAEFDIA